LPTAPSTARPWLPNVLLGLFSTLGFFLMSEGVLRLWGPDLEVAGLDVRQGGNPLVASFRSDDFVRDPELMWAPRPSHGLFNAEGYRGPIVARPKPPGELRILAVGDSNTLGGAASWANDLAVALDPQVLGRQRTTVVNTALYGYTSYQGRLRLEQFRDFEPDLVLISFGGNEASLNVAPDRAFHVSGWNEFLDRWSSRLRLAALVRYAGYRLAHRKAEKTAQPPAPVARVSLAEYREYLREMIVRSRELGARPVVFTRPFAYEEYAAERNRPLRPYYLATQEVAAAEKAPLIDLHRIMGCHRSLYVDHSHFNARGHAVASRLVAQALTDIVARGTYDPDKVRYWPVDGPYEALLDELYTKVHLWLSLPKARTAFQAVVGDRARPLFDLAAPSSPPGFGIEDSSGKLDLQPGRLCLGASPPSAGTILSLPPDPNGYVFLWLEMDSSIESGVQLYWDAGGGFSDEDTIADVFSGSVTQRPYRLSHLFPRGVTRIQLHLRPAGGARIGCLRQLWIERIAAPPAATPGQP
jgi:lysophospholipase L1-like esterase